MSVGLPLVKAVSIGAEAFAISVRLLDGVWVRSPKNMDAARAIAANTTNKFLSRDAAEFVSEFLVASTALDFGELGVIKLITILILGFYFK